VNARSRSPVVRGIVVRCTFLLRKFGHRFLPDNFLDQLQGFGKDYADVHCRESIDLEIAAGETFGFIGPTGPARARDTGFLARCSGRLADAGEVAGLR